MMFSPGLRPPRIQLRALDIRHENLQQQNELLRTVLAYLLDEVEAKHGYGSELEWELALTIAVNKARKVLGHDQHNQAVAP